MRLTPGACRTGAKSLGRERCTLQRGSISVRWPSTGGDRVVQVRDEGSGWRSLKTFRFRPSLAWLVSEPRGCFIAAGRPLSSISWGGFLRNFLRAPYLYAWPWVRFKSTAVQKHGGGAGTHTKKPGIRGFLGPRCIRAAVMAAEQGGGHAPGTRRAPCSGVLLRCGACVRCAPFALAPADVRRCTIARSRGSRAGPRRAKAYL